MKHISDLPEDFYRSITVPTRPYMLALGTSHTFGQNLDYKVDKTFADYIANELGLQLINFSYPGVTSAELPVIFMELYKKGFIKNKNLKYFLLETRLYDGYFNFPIEHVIEENTKGWSDRFTAMQEVTFPNVYEQFYPPRSDYLNIAAPGITWKNKNAEDFTFFSVTDVDRDKFKFAFESYKNYIALHADTQQKFISTIIEIAYMFALLPKQTKRDWWCATSVNTVNKSFIDLYYPEIKYPVFEYITYYFDDQYTEEYFAPCQHLNQKGHMEFYNRIKDNIKKSYYSD